MMHLSNGHFVSCRNSVIDISSIGMMFICCFSANMSVDVLSHTCTDRHHCFESGDIHKTDGGQIHLNFLTVL